MRIFQILRIVLLSLYWRLPTERDDFFAAPVSLVRELRKEKRKTKRLKKSPLIRRQKYFHRGYKSSKPKGHRFSDQRKLRRMYRND